jgi:hypothetical protein
MDPAAVDPTVSMVQLWLPIIVSAVLVFIASSLAWMVLPHHKKDIQKLPDEAALTSKIRELDVPPGQYMWPNCADHVEMKSDEYKARFNEGPWGSMIISGKPNFGQNLLLCFLFYVVVGVFVAYISVNAREAGAAYLSVYQIAGASAFMAYALGGIPQAIFFSHPKRSIVANTADAFVYAMLTAGAFAGFWPGAPTAG